MRGWWRFRRRSTELDDLISAYVEGRTDAGDEARVRQHLLAEPETQVDVDGLRATVALLHSIAPAKAPRSFALQEAPAPAPRPLIRYEWAPALASAAAAVIVGLLLLGDVSGIVTQTAAPRPEAQPIAQAVPAAAPETPRLFGAPGVVPEVVVETVVVEMETVIEKEAPLPAEAPARMKAPRAAPPEEAAIAAAPLAERAALDAAEKGAAPRPAQALKALAPGEEVEALLEEAPGAPIPEATPSPPPLLAPAPREAVGTGPAAEPSEDGGFSLPVRQLEIAFGAAAVVLAAGAWLLLRRRGRPS